MATEEVLNLMSVCVMSDGGKGGDGGLMPAGYTQRSHTHKKERIEDRLVGWSVQKEGGLLEICRDEAKDLAASCFP
jgi:hypothetical protein